jgi:hypothetical protein
MFKPTNVTIIGNYSINETQKDSYILSQTGNMTQIDFLYNIRGYVSSKYHSFDVYVMIN